MVMVVKLIEAIRREIRSKFPEWLRVMITKHEISAVKHFFERIEAEFKRLDKADDEVSIDAVRTEVTKIIDELIGTEQNITGAQQSVETLEYQGAKFFHEINEKLRQFHGRLKDDGPLKAQLKSLLDEFEKMRQRIEGELVEQRELSRRVTIERLKTTDQLAVVGILFKYMHLRHVVREIGHEESEIRDENHKIIRDLHKLTREGNHDKIVKHLNENLHRLAEAMQKVVDDALDMTREDFIMREHLIKYRDRLVAFFGQIKEDGFDAELVQQFMGEVDDFNREYHDHLEHEFAGVRVNVDLVR